MADNTPKVKGNGHKLRQRSSISSAVPPGSVKATPRQPQGPALIPVPDTPVLGRRRTSAYRSTSFKWLPRFRPRRLILVLLAVSTATKFKFCPVSTSTHHIPTAILIGTHVDDPRSNRTYFAPEAEPFLPLVQPHREKRFAQDLKGGLGQDQARKSGQGRLHLPDEPKEEGTQQCVSSFVPSTAPLPVDRSKTQADVMFGTAANADAVLRALPVWDHWLPGSRAALDPRSETAKRLPLLHVLNGPTTPTERARMIEAVEDAQARGMNVDIKIRKTDRVATRFFALVQDLWKAAQTRQSRDGVRTNWFVLIEDDTFFPDYQAVLKMLSAHSSAHDVIIGADSSSKKLVSDWGHLANSGAGIFMSSSLMAKLNAQGVWDDCLARFGTRHTGPGILSRCAALVMSKASVEDAVTFEPSLHQIDIRGDATGYFQSAYKILSMTHWSSWYALFPNWLASGHGDARKSVALIGRAAAGVGGDNWRRRFVFDNGRIVVVLGYSVTIYDQALTADDLSRVEHTWIEHEPFFPLRNALEEGVKKRTYYLTSARLIEQGVTRLVHQNKEGERVDIVFDNRGTSSFTARRIISNAKAIVGV